VALAHNQLSSFPSRLAECTLLRYLNVRNNQFREFPLPLCDLKSLEILDLSKNKIRLLPPDIVRLTSLKVFSVEMNRIQELPLCLADMTSLQVLKWEGNDITFPPPEVFKISVGSPPNKGYLKDNEVTEVAVTTNIKRFLRRTIAALNGKAESDTGGDESSEGTETPRMPMKRVMSGRFPIKVNGSEVPDIRSPAQARPPPIPSRSHYRGLSQQSTAVRRSNVMPLTIGGNISNERVRSNSETLLQQPRQSQNQSQNLQPERPESRNRRMGIVPKKSELTTLDEGQANNRFSHYRGLSHGSAMQGPVPTLTSKSPATPTEPYMQRPIYVRRLSILPERRRESKVFDAVMETAKGVLYSVFQIHPMIQMLMSLTSDGSAKRSSLEIVFYNTNSHVEELEQEIQKHDPANADDEYVAAQDNENVYRACMTLVSAYTHVCTHLANYIDTFVDNGDPRYIRTLLTLLYNSITELRVTMMAVMPDDGYRRSANRAALGGDTIRPHSRESSVTPTAERPSFNQRARNGTFVHNPSNLRVATDVPMPMPMPYINGSGRTATISSATPRSGESFTSSTTSGGRAGNDFSDDDRQFEKIFLSLQRSSELVMRTLPDFITQLTAGLRNAMTQRERSNMQDEALRCWKALVAKATTAVHQTETLKQRMSQIKLKEPGIRTQKSFWNVCNNFIDSWGEFGGVMKHAMMKYQLPLPADSKSRMRPVHLAIKETTDLILVSPWSYFLRNPNAQNAMSPLSTGEGQLQVPMTPQSAALGPAVQATVPSTPQSASFSSAFSGGVFERADALISYGGLSMSSRSGTFSTGGTSVGSVGNGTLTPSSVISPGSGGMPGRMNGGMNGKPSF
jgi:hypothetical protein